MPDIPRVLVVGTTPDYIDWIRCQCPGRALFLTDPSIRHGAKETRPGAHEEVLCNLSDHDQAKGALKNHLRTWGLSLDGITSYDCESMALTAFLARELSLPYPSVEAVGNCRDKFRSKILWHQHGVNCPRTRLVSSEKDAADFFKELGGPIVIKPTTGSGSELVFYCESGDECERGYKEIISGLMDRRGNRLYKMPSGDDALVLAEEFIAGEEFSCDFLMEDGRAGVIRISRKIPDQESPFGTTMAYVLPSSLPSAIDPIVFQQTLYGSAEVLGLTRAVCMLDFLIRDGAMVLLEMSPRPGGDCLPFLMRHRFNLDMLKLNLDFAQQIAIRIPHPDTLDPFIGLRLHARKGGILGKIDAAPLRQDPRVREIHLLRTPGHVIKMPPADYDSWLLGHVIFKPHRVPDLASQCAEILKQITVEVG
ncbi:MAG: ATP-grasp domain-containing protein [Deltaproteobacteria bacterium]|nr:ATP-grasp domain-containing protein [Deltaproteobacteria bacterium]